MKEKHPPGSGKASTKLQSDFLVAANLQGPWFQAAGNQKPSWDKYRLPPKVRQGSMFPITRNQYNASLGAFGKGPANLSGKADEK
jgi:hypothetical protein